MLDKVNPKWALIWVLIGAAGFNSLMAVGNTLTWFNVTWFLSRAVYVSLPHNLWFLSAMPAGFGQTPLIHTSAGVMHVAMQGSSALDVAHERHVHHKVLSFVLTVVCVLICRQTICSLWCRHLVGWRPLA